MLIPQELNSIVDTRPIVCQAAFNAFGGECGRPVLDEGRRVGTRYECADASYCFLEELVPADVNASREEQTQSLFETIERVLHAEGLEFGHLTRTWFYLDKLLDWYDSFNRVRTPFLKARGAFEGLMPASTGIGMPNCFGAAIVAGALAIKPNGAVVREVASPMQGPAVAYKSSFSRAVEVERDGRRELYISGTASIAPGGETVHLGDTRAQIELTMDVVAALLQSRQMDWANTSRAIAYIKYPQDAPLFAEYLRGHGLEDLPLMWMHSDVCRDNLLFEIELDATVAK